MLAARLRRRIQETGPITFAEFMESALYDPNEGFYSAAAVGERGHFVTSPHTSPLFAELMARQLQELRGILGGPEPFTVVEAGAGDGTLGRQIIGALPAEDLPATEYVFVERGTSAQRALADLTPTLGIAARTAGDIGGLEAGSVEGCILANELLDNLPFRLGRCTSEGLVERLVSLGDADGPDAERPFVLVDGPTQGPAFGDTDERDEVDRLTRELAPGQEFILPTGALEFLGRVAQVLRRGYVLLIDYAMPGPASSLDLAAVHGYRRHHVVADVLADPGSRDITAAVDFGILARRASALGLLVWEPVLQSDALRALGYTEVVHAMRDRQVEALEAGRGVDAARRFSDRNRASLLVDPAGLGGFRVLGAGAGVDTPPRCVRPQ